MRDARTSLIPLAQSPKTVTGLFRVWRVLARDYCSDVFRGKDHVSPRLDFAPQRSASATLLSVCLAVLAPILDRERLSRSHLPRSSRNSHEHTPLSAR
jgi:hypothetical protein